MDLFGRLGKFSCDFLLRRELVLCACCGRSVWMEDSVDYSSDRVSEREIFSRGRVTGGMDLSRVPEIPPTGRGPVITSGPVNEMGLDGVLFDQSLYPVGSQPFSSLELEGLESELEFFRTSKGLGGARSSLAGILGEPFPSSSGFHTFFPLISSE